MALLPITEDDSCTNASNWSSLSDHGAPKGQYQSESRDLKRDQKGLIEAILDVLANRPVTSLNKKAMNGQKVPSDHETKGVVHPFTSETDEATADGVRRCHLRNTVVHHSQKDRLDGEGQEQAPGSTIVQTSADTHEESSSDGASNGNELNLAVTKVTLKVVSVVRHHAFLHIVWAIAGLEPHGVEDTGALVLFLTRKSHVGLGPMNRVGY